jgi:hypothetical protein
VQTENGEIPDTLKFMRKEGRIKPTEPVEKEQNNNQIKRMIRTNEQGQKCV